MNARNKGADAERELILELRKFFPRAELRRNLDQTRDGGQDILGLEGWAPEIKRQEKLQLEAWWRQTVQQAKEDTPVLFYRQSRRPWRVVVPMDTIGGAPTGANYAMTAEVSLEAFARIAKT